MNSGKAKATVIRYRRKRGGIDRDEECSHLIQVLDVLCTLGSWQKTNGKLRRGNWKGYNTAMT